MERVLTDIDADYGNRSPCCRKHGVLLVLAPLASLSLAGQEHGRTIPLAETERHCLHEENFNGHGAVVSYLNNVRTTKETDVVQIVNDAQ